MGASGVHTGVPVPSEHAPGIEVRRAFAEGRRDGLHLFAEVVQAHGIIAVETRLENRRSEPVFLVPDRGGRVTEALLVRARHEPEGRVWPGSLQALKRLVLARQREGQAPERLAPRLPGTSSQEPPAHQHLGPALRLAPGQSVHERWETDWASKPTLDAVGSDNTLVRVEVVEARDSADLELLDDLPAGVAEGARTGRNLRVDVPASEVMDHPPREAQPELSLGQLFDKLLERDRLRNWLAEQPVRSWRRADLMRSATEVRFSAVTDGYERAVVVRARADGTQAVVRLPGPAHRLRTFKSRLTAMPSGIPRVPTLDAQRAIRDVLAPALAIPSGRIVLGEFPPDGADRLEHRAAPGVCRLRVTLARPRGLRTSSVALATLVMTDEPPLSWRLLGRVDVPGGVATVTSLEGSEVLDWMVDDARAFRDYSEHVADSLDAHEHLTEVAIEEGLNQVVFRTGEGGGSFPVFAGLDATWRTAQLVIDFGLLDLAWPDLPGS